MGPTAKARLMHRLRRKGEDSALVLLPLGTQRFDRTGRIADGRKAHPDHLLAAGVSSGAPVLREVSLSDTAPAASATRPAISRQPPSCLSGPPNAIKRFACQGSHVATERATLEQPLVGQQVAVLQIARALRLVRSGMGSSGWACSDSLILLQSFMKNFLMTFFPATLPSSLFLVHLSGQIFPAESFLHPPQGAVLERDNLSGADLRGADLHGANLEGALQPHFLNSPIKSLEQG